MKKILVTGATGFLGSRIADFYQDKYKILAPAHREMDITNQDNVWQYFRTFKPDIVVHCAAVSDVSTCEKQQEYSWKINVTGTENIARAAKEISATCICCSSDQVYGGSTEMQANREDCPLNPVNVYGKEKAYAEQSASSIYDDCVHLRLSWMYDAGDDKRMDFVKQLKACLKNTTEITFSSKDRRGITDVWEVVQNMEQAFALPGGIYNFGAPNDRTMYETAVHIFEEKGYDISKIGQMQHANFRNLTLSQEKINSYGIYFSATAEGVLKAWNN